MVEVVNVVASGALHTELGLEAVATDCPDIVDYDPNKYPGAYVRLESTNPLVTLYRTGKYIITGSKSEAQSRQTREEFLTRFTEQGILPNATTSGSPSGITSVWTILSNTSTSPRSSSASA